MSGIRVTYSGLISFAVGLISIITGLIFTLVITRRLSPEEFGTWGVIGGILVYPLIIQPIIGYWSTREIARNENSGKTAIVTSGYFSIVSMLIYLIVAYIISIETDASFNILLLAILLVPSQFVNLSLTSINLGWKPHSVSYALVGFESIKIPIGFLLIYFLDLGVVGAIITTFVAQLGSIIILAWSAKEKLVGKIQNSFIKKWIKLSWIPLYGNVQNTILSLDILVFTIITGSVIGISFWSAAIAVANIVGHSGSISQALYSKLVSGGKEKHVEENLVNVLYFAIPLCSLSIVFAKPGVFTLNPLYVEAFPIVIFMSFKALLVVLRGILDATLSGLEKVDMDKESTMKNYLKSKLFFLPTLKNIHHGIYIISLIVILGIISQNNVKDLDLVIYWSIIALIVQIPFTIYSYYLVKREISINIFKINIVKYLIVSTGIFGITYFLIENYIVYEIEIFRFLPNILLLVAFSTISYIIITYFIDTRTKKFIKSIISEIFH